MRTLAWFIALAAAAGAQERFAVDWDKLRPDVVERFRELLRIDTSNPPGSETRAANAVATMLEREGIATRQFALDPARANLVARLKGSGAKRPILLLGHTDVVGVQREKWSVDPFAAVLKDGEIWGRGSRDDKPHVIAGVMTLLLLKRMNVKLDRDVIFLAEAGEEGTAQYGIDYMIREHWPEIECEYALAEGGAIVAEGGKPRYLLVSNTEKNPQRIRLVAHGTAGHGSRPTMDNAVVHLAAAVAKAGTWSTPVRLSETTRAYFAGLAPLVAPAAAARYRALAAGGNLLEIDRYLREREPAHYSMLRTSVAPTIINGGFRSNVIPSEAEATLDVRALPDEDMAGFVAELRRVIADPAVEVIPPKANSRPFAPPSGIDNEMFRALAAAGRREFGAPALPYMMTGATDMAQLRAKGVQAYGTGPMANAEEGALGGAHSDNERIPVASLMAVLRWTWDAVTAVAAH
ncbi:MAG: M20/M25/M40 family metallo-hydrolase [Acidobacteria bacterium]|nr:M20/M25/M40 family metallo-hydrolase [Acidobacteriota bacterium]